MTRDEIITEVSTNKEYQRICYNMLSNLSLSKDLYQDLLLILLEYPEEKFKRIPNLNQAKFFIIGILCNMVHSNRSAFHKTYRTSVSLPDEIEDTTDENYEPDERIERMESIFKEENWFDKELLNLYIEHGSFEKIEKATNINSTFAFRTIKKLQSRIHNKLKMVKVLLITQAEENALKFHRQISPNVRLMKTHLEEFEVKKQEGFFENGKKYEGTIDGMTDDELREFNIVYYLRQISFRYGRAKETVERCHKLGLKVIMDIDDNWKLSSSHHNYKYYKEQNVRKITEDSLRNADHVITTTDFFADEIRKFNPNVTVIPNCINPDDLQFKSREIESPRLRFGWIGGVYHKPDIEMMDSAFCKVAKDSDIKNKVQICLGGYNYPNPEYEQIEKIMSCNYDFRYSDATYTEYLFTQTTTGDHISYDKPYRRLWARDVHNYGQLYNEIDVALVPLRQDKFNGCKSELKIVEAGWMKKPVIVSDVLPYNKFIKHGKNGLKVNPFRAVDWYMNIKKLTNEPELRNDLAEALHETIKENFDMDKHNETRLQLYKSLI